MSALTELSANVERIKLKPDQEQELCQALGAFITEHVSDTAEFRKNIIIQRRLYEMKSRRKTWPWVGAANYILPILRYAADQYIAKIQQQYRSLPSLWFGRATHEEVAGEVDWNKIANLSAKFMNFVCTSPGHIDFFNDFLPDASDFLVKDGNVPIKVHYVTRTKKRVVVGKDGKKQTIEEPYEARVVWEPYDVIRCMWNVGAEDPDDAILFGHWTDMVGGKFKAWASDAGVSKEKIDKVLMSPDEPWLLEEERILAEELGARREQNVGHRAFDVIRVCEINLEWDFGDGPACVTVWYHHKSDTLLSAFNPSGYAKPWEFARFIKRGKQMLGGSIPEALRVINLGANTIMNQATDAQTVANAHGFLYKGDGKLATSIANGGVFPGVKLPFDEDQKKEFGTFQLGSGNVGQSVNLVNFYLEMAEMIAKIGPAGQVTDAQRAPAGGIMSIMAEGNQMIDAVQARFRTTIERCGQRTIVLYANFDPKVFDQALGADDATLLLGVLRDHTEDYVSKTSITLNVTSSINNEDKDKQDLMTLLNILMGVYEKLLAAAVPYTDPSIPVEWKMIAQQVYKGLFNVVERLLQKFEQFKNPDLVLPPGIMEGFEAILAGAVQMQRQGMGGFPRMQQGGGGQQGQQGPQQQQQQPPQRGEQ